MADIDYSQSTIDALQDFVQRYASTIDPGIYIGDPGMVGVEDTFNPDLRADSVIGIVEAAIPATGLYVVRRLATSQQLVCSQINENGGFLGVSDLSSITVGTQVFVNVVSGINTITGVRPDRLYDPSSAFFDFLSPGCGFSLYASPLYRKYYDSLADSPYMPVNKAYGMYDAIAGDKTLSTPTGVMLHIDADMTMLRTSEICGLFLFRESGHTRLSGEMLETESLQHRNVHGIDNGESFGFEQQFFYTKELFGVPQDSDTGSISYNEPSFVYSGTQTYAEASSANAVPIARFTRISGFLGQGEQLIVSSPQWTSPDNVQTDELPVREQGLSRSYVGRDGTILIESARQICLAKTADVLWPRLKGEPTYDGEDYKPNDPDREYPPNDNAFSSSDTAGQLPLENYANLAGWQSLVTAVARPDVNVLSAPASSGLASFDLTDTDEVLPPPAITAKIDEAYGNVSIEQVLSLFTILPNGDIVLQNGLGASVKLSKGTVSISGTGVHVHSAKAMSIMARDVTVRGHNSAEFVSSTGSVRIKADKDLLMLAANSGSGGMILEHRGVGSDYNLDDEPADTTYSGIVIKSSLSHVAVLGGTVALKTGPASAGNFEGRIIIDSGNRELITRAGTHRRYTGGAFFDHFGNSPDTVRATNFYASSGTYISGVLTNSSSIVSGGFIQCVRGVYTARGAFATGEERYTPYVYRNPDPTAIINYVTTQSQQSAEYGQQGAETLTDIRTELEENNKPLNIESIRRTAFGFPSTEKYGAKSQIIKESYWQQLPITGKAAWNETPVRYPTASSTSGVNMTLPWPGKENWTGNKMIKVEQPNVLFSPYTQRIINPDQDAASANKYKNSTSDDYKIKYVTASSNFMIIR